MVSYSRKHCKPISTGDQEQTAWWEEKMSSSCYCIMKQTHPFPEDIIIIQHSPSSRDDDGAFFVVQGTMELPNYSKVFLDRGVRVH